MTKKKPEQLSAQTTEEDSEKTPAPTAAERAAQLADGVLHTPTTNDQAIELAKVYALIAVAEALSSPQPKKEN